MNSAERLESQFGAVTGLEAAVLMGAGFDLGTA
jgi:hypothetical protein